MNEDGTSLQNDNTPKTYIRNRMNNYPSPQPVYPDPNNQQPVAPQTNVNEQITQPQPTYYQAPVEKFPVQPEQNKGIGCSPFTITNAFFKTIGSTFSLIKNTLLTALMIIILTLLATVLILIYKPPIFWNPIKTFLNDNISKPVAAKDETETLEELYKRINLTALSNESVTITDSELTLIMRSNTFLEDKCFIKTTKDSMKFFINIDSEERPLWFITETKINNENRIEVENAGFGKFNTPQEVAAIVNDTLGVVFQFIEQQVTADSVVAAFSQIIDTSRINEKLELEKVEFEDASIVLFFKNNSELETIDSDFSY